MTNEEILETRKKWVEALRSGEYKQGRRYLRNSGNEFCCLGVLCDLIDPERWSSKPTYGPSNSERVYGYFDEGYENPNTAILPESLEDLVGINGVHYAPDLMAMNDYGKNFREIADWIEEKLVQGT